MWAELLSGVAGGGGGGGGGTYGNSGSSGVSTPVTTNVGGIGANSFDFSNRAFAPQTNWLLIGGLALAAWFLLRRGK